MSELTQVLRHLAPVQDANALVDASTGDDAAVYRLSADRALVVTADFFAPVVDDPFDFGRIAAANALSDVYAMGARPLFALNLVGFPRGLLGEGLLDEIIRGGSETCGRAGIPILGGHSIDDTEPKYGLVAVGEVHPDRILTNAGARAGDLLVLTKPLGSGVVATAIKAGAAAPEVVRAAVEVMAALNAEAAREAVSAGVEACTDVTGFGLLGHLHRLLLASGVSAEVRASDVPLLEGAALLAAAGHVPGGSARNADDLRDSVTWTAPLSPPTRTLLTDAQTSGGLLMCVAPGAVDRLLGALASAAPSATVIGRVTAGAAGAISVL